jgi:hypothetical protein
MTNEKSDQAPLPAQKVSTLLLELKPALSSLAKGSIDSEGPYGCALRASLAKSFEFTILAHQQKRDDQSFFKVSTLRGICEDLIVLTFVGRLDFAERNEVISLLLSKSIAKGIEAQSAFFGRRRPWQPVLHPNTNSDLSTESRLRELARDLGWSGKKSWPSVWFMAKAVAQEELYKYIYAVTSKQVHFSPHILFRMGWGGVQGSVGNTTAWEFTTTNFIQYYAEFNEVYSLMLFLDFVKGPAAALMPPESASIISALQSWLSSILRWPEDVTFEEMNLRSPGFISRLLMQIEGETQDKIR